MNAKHGLVFFGLIFALFTAGCCSNTATAPQPTPRQASRTSLGTSSKTTTIANSIADCEAGLGTPGANEYTVDITFSGIGVFDRTTDGMISVRLPNLTAGRPAINDGSGKEIRPPIAKHIAYILTDMDTAKPLMDAGIKVTQAHFEKTCYVYYTITNDLITVADTSAPPGTNGNLCLTDASDSNGCPDAATRGSMKWVPSIKNVLGSAQPQESAHFKGPDGSTISGVIQVDRGYIEPVVETSSKKVWAFLNKDGDSETGVVRQAIAQEIHWHMRGTGSQFVLHLLRSDGSKLDLPFAPVNRLVELFIANSPADETGPIHSVHPMGSDPHFRAYYEFINNFNPATGPLPFKSANPKCPAGTKTGNPALEICGKCPNDADCNAPPAGQSLPSGLNCGDTQWP